MLYTVCSCHDRSPDSIRSVDMDHNAVAFAVCDIHQFLYLILTKSFT